jgi:hypothetical protein
MPLGKYEHNGTHNDAYLAKIIGKKLNFRLRDLPDGSSRPKTHTVLVPFANDKYCKLHFAARLQGVV